MISKLRAHLAADRARTAALDAAWDAERTRVLNAIGCPAHIGSQPVTITRTGPQRGHAWPR